MNSQHQIKTEELLVGLERSLCTALKTDCHITDLRRRHSPYSSSFNIENLNVTLDDGQRLKIVFKNLSPDSLLGAARKVRPEFLYNPAREIETYRKILNPERLGTAVCYGAISDPKHDVYWLFLERVNGPLLWQMGRIEIWQQAARWLACLHQEFALSCNGHQNRRTSHLIHFDRELLELWLHRAQDFLSHKNPVRTMRMSRAFDQLIEKYDKVIVRLIGLPRTIIHGEFYPSNIILRHKQHKNRVCPIDWEVASVGPGLIDLAALTSGKWSSQQRLSLITAYREVLDLNAHCALSLSEMIEAVDYCQLHLAVQWLGWSADWSPPRMHAQNWLREAVRLSKSLGITNA